MATSKIQDFTQGNITKQLIGFAFPLLLSNLLQVVYNMVDMVIVGHVLGKTGTSAVAVGGDITSFLTFVAIGFSGAGQVLIAKYIGAKQQDRLGKFVGTMCGFLLTCALVISAVGLLLQGSILQWMNTPAESYEGARAYSAISISGLVFIYGYNMVSAILRGMGDSRHPFLFVSIAVFMNVFLDLLLVVVIPMGPAGAALATIISQGFSFAACTVFLARHKEAYCLTITWRDFFRWDRAMLGSLTKLGIPMAIKGASVQFSKLFVNSWINSYGVAVSAFAGIANKISVAANMFATAMSTAGSTMVGQNLAAGEFRRVKQILLRIFSVIMPIMLTLSALVALFPTGIFQLFTTDSAVLAIAGGYVPIAVLLFISSALRGTMNPLINGSGFYKINFFTAIFDGVIMRIGLAVLFGLGLQMQHYGFWLGDALAGFTPFVIGVIFYLSGKWKKKAEA